MNTHRRRNPKRTNLFLVRLWRESTLDRAEVTSVGYSGGAGDAEGAEEWSGSVLRVVDGESRQFRSRQSLMDTLAMLSETTGRLDR